MALILPPLRVKVNGTECFVYVNACEHGGNIFEIPMIAPLEEIHLVMNEGPYAREVLPQEALQRLKKARVVAAESYENTRFYSGVLEELIRREKLPDRETAIEILSEEKAKEFEKLMGGYKRAGKVAKGLLGAQAGAGALIGAQFWFQLKKPSRRAFLKKMGAAGFSAALLNTLVFSANWAKILELKAYTDFGKQATAAPKDLQIFYQKMRQRIAPRGIVEGRSAVIAQSVVDEIKEHYSGRKEPLNVLVDTGAAHGIVRNYLGNEAERKRMLIQYRKELLKQAQRTIRKEKAKRKVRRLIKGVKAKRPKEIDKREFLRKFLPRK